MSTQNNQPAARPPSRLESIWLALAPVLGRLSLAVLFAAFGLFLFVKIAHELGEADTRAFDRSVIQFFQAHQSAPLHALMTALSWVSGPVALPTTIVVSVIGFALARRFWPDGAALLLASLGGWGLIEVLKHLFHRPRYDTAFSHLGSSFPSGHAFFALTVYGMLTYWLTRDMPPHRRRIVWSVCVAAILLVGFSRVFLGAHYPTDVAAGFAVAVPWLWGCLALPTAFRRKGRDI